MLARITILFTAFTIGALVASVHYERERHDDAISYMQEIADLRTEQALTGKCSSHSAPVSHTGR